MNSKQEIVFGGTTKVPLQESVNVRVGQAVYPECEIMTFTNGYKAGLHLGIYKGIIRSGTPDRYTERYVIERSDGKRSLMHYRNFVRADTPFRELDGFRF